MVVMSNLSNAPSKFNCHFCPVCDGYGCIGKMPGMGGPFSSRNFIHNCNDWASIPTGPVSGITPELRLSPITGAVENVGYWVEKFFYYDIVRFAAEHKLKISIGDGTPDFKLLYGIEAVKKIQEKTPETKAAVFIKPYPDSKIIERSLWADSVAEIFGIDIDAYNIITMRNLVHLEKKTPSQLIELKRQFNARGKPFAIKGIFTQEDVETVKAVKPDIAFISNHGGRVETREGSTAVFLQQYADELRSAAGKLWVDGGIRNQSDIAKAASYGVSTVLLGRPVISALCASTVKIERPILL